MTPEQLQVLLSEAVKSGVSAAMQQAATMNPLEQRKFEDEMAKDRRRALMLVELGKTEAENMARKKNGCSHMRNDKTGYGIQRGATNGEWTTSGQAYQDGTAMVICLRCGTTWRFRPNAETYSAILQNGLLGVTPPTDEYLLCSGCLRPAKQCVCDEIAQAHKEGRQVQEVAAVA
jgi:hypothetical protein